MFAFFVSRLEELEGDPANQMPVSDTFFRSIPYRRYGTHSNSFVELLAQPQMRIVILKTPA